MPLASARFMQHPAWTKPEFRELNLSAEIGSYYEEEDIPLFVTAARAPRSAVELAQPAQEGERDGGRA
jgi:coenzyme PQQ precursor peptide PqqA